MAVPDERYLTSMEGDASGVLALPAGGCLLFVALDLTTIRKTRGPALTTRQSQEVSHVQAPDH